MKYEIEIPDDVAAKFQGHTPTEFRPTLMGEWILTASGPYRMRADCRDMSLILSPPKAEPKFEPGAYWRWSDLHGERIVRVLAPPPRAASPTYDDGPGVLVETNIGNVWSRRLNLREPWLPRRDERVYHCFLCEYGTVTGESGGSLYLVAWDGWSDRGMKSPCDAELANLIPAAFAPRPEPVADAEHPANDPPHYKDQWTGPAAQRDGYAKKPEPISIDLAEIVNIFETSESGMARIAGMFGTIAGQLRRLAEGQVSL